MHLQAEIEQHFQNAASWGEPFDDSIILLRSGYIAPVTNLADLGPPVGVG